MAVFIVINILYYDTTVASFVRYFVKYLCLLREWLFKRAKIYHLKVHISHKKVKQGAKVTAPARCLGHNSCGLISFQARTLALLDLSRHAALLGVLLDETISFQESDCSLFEKKKDRFYSSIDGKQMLFFAFSCSLSSPS